jgi:carbohydrate-selective porin OprB
VQVPLDDHWSWTVQGAWTAGASLSARAIGDVEGVQGPFNSGNGLWLYELKATYSDDRLNLQAGRISSGDALPGVSGMGEFVNSAFTSNGGIISVNDPGRATTPMSAWGVRGRYDAGGVELRGGAFLSDPRRMTLRKHGLDLTFNPSDGVLAYGEAVAPVAGSFKAGLGAYGDSARLQTFAGDAGRGNEGYYLWLERPQPDKGASLSGFAMVQVAPRDDRNLEPLFLMGGLIWRGVNPRRPADALSFGATTGWFSDKSPLRGSETTLEVDYHLRLTDHLLLRPDLQYVISPGGRDGGPDALVLGLQLEASL